MKTSSLLLLSLLPLAGCGPGMLEFSESYFSINAVEGSAEVVFTLYRRDGCTGEASDITAVLNGAEAVVALEDHYGGGGGLPPSFTPVSCDLQATQTITFAGDGEAVDLDITLTSGDSTLQGTAPGRLRHMALSAPAGEVAAGSTVDFTVSSSLTSDFAVNALLTMSNGTVTDAPSEVVLPSTIRVSFPDDASAGSAKISFTIFAPSETCEVDGTACVSVYTFVTERDLTIGR